MFCLGIGVSCRFYHADAFFLTFGSSGSSRERFAAGGPPEMTRRLSLPQHQPERYHHSKPLSTEGSIIPGETEEDGLLRREYVLVGDTRAVEFNRTIDGKPVPLPISYASSVIKYI